MLNKLPVSESFWTSCKCPNLRWRQLVEFHIYNSVKVKCNQVAYRRRIQQKMPFRITLHCLHVWPSPTRRSIPRVRWRCQFGHLVPVPVIVVSLVMEPNDVCPIGVAWAQVLMLMVIKDITQEETMCYPPCPYTERWSFLKWQNIQLLINVNHLHPPAILKI